MPHTGWELPLPHYVSQLNNCKATLHARKVTLHRIFICSDFIFTHCKNNSVADNVNSLTVVRTRTVQGTGTQGTGPFSAQHRELSH